MLYSVKVLITIQICTHSYKKSSISVVPSSGNDRVLRVPTEAHTEDFPRMHHKKHAVWAHSLHRLGQVSLQVRLILITITFQCLTFVLSLWEWRSRACTCFEKQLIQVHCFFTVSLYHLCVACPVSCLEKKMQIRRFPLTQRTQRQHVSDSFSFFFFFCSLHLRWWHLNMLADSRCIFFTGKPEDTAARATASEKDGDIKRVSTKQWARSTGYDPVKLFNKVPVW